MIAMDRFQAICYPMNNHFWQPSRSKQKIFIAWSLSIIMCIPHALIFKETDNNGDHGGTICSAQLGETPQGLFLKNYYYTRFWYVDSVFSGVSDKGRFQSYIVGRKGVGGSLNVNSP